MGHFKGYELNCIVFLIVPCLRQGGVFCNLCGQSVCCHERPFWEGLEIRMFRMYSPLECGYDTALLMALMFIAWPCFVNQQPVACILRTLHTFTRPSGPCS